MNKPDSVLVVLIDGMRGDYINKVDTPFIHEQVEKGLYIKELEKEAPFCERSEIYTGENSSVTGNYAAFTYDPENSPFSALDGYNSYLHIADFLNFTLPLFLRGKFGHNLYRLFKKLRVLYTQRMLDCSSDISVYSVNDIPSKFLSQFRLTEDHYPYNHSSAFDVPSVFSKLEEHGKKYAYFFDDLRVEKSGLSRDERFEMLKSLFGSDYDVYFYADSEIDAITHVYGTAGDARKDVVKKVDSMLRELHDKFVMNHKNGTTILFSPHGMIDVEKYFSPEESMLQFFKENNLKILQDVVYFIDSTMVRVWGSGAHKVKELFMSKEWLDHGAYVDDEIGKEYNIKKNISSHEEVWWAKPGVCNFPDFFRKYKPPKGMHGYFMDSLEMNGFATITGPDVESDVIKNAKLKNLYNTILHTQDIVGGGENRKSWLLEH